MAPAVTSSSGSSDVTTSDVSSDNLHDDFDGVGLSDPLLSQGRRRTLDLINRLHSTGVQVDLDLPMIAVIGNQSAGKSSLIESISGITLPRAAGTCTRCPTECRLSYTDGPWVCKISLRFMTDENGRPLGQVRNETFGPAITNRAEVEERIQRAQLAILNPRLPSEHFLRSDEMVIMSNQLTFSHNCVSLQITGREIADLSFVDLPGLIATVSEDADKNDIQLVQNLVTSYIKKESCIILLTVACETDFENQGAHQLAKRYDPNGTRTVGVLTKPDRIQEGEHEQWLPFIRNTKEPLQNNWFCVKQPSPKRLKEGITWKQARKEEDDFFSSSAPWSSLESTHQQLLRTKNLTQRLSFILSDLISKRLPEIQEELQQLMEKTHEEIRQLPRPPSNDPLGEVFQVLGTFTRDLSRHLKGIAEKDGLLQLIRPAEQAFKRKIRSTAPDFRPYERSLADSHTMPPVEFLDSEEDASDLYRQSDSAFSGKKNAKIEISDHEYAIYIDEVFDRAAQSRTRELPDIYPFIVYEWFIKNVIQAWKNPSLELFHSVQSTMSAYVKDVLRRHFESFGNGTLYHRILLIFHEHIKTRSDKTLSQLEWLLDLETQPFTVNTHYYSDYKDKFLSYYRAVRRGNDDSIDYDSGAASNGSELDAREDINSVLSELARIGYTGIKAEDLIKLSPPDPYEPALEIMASVRAYFQVAFKRFADNIPMAIDREFVRGFEYNLQETLCEKLGISGVNGHEICRELVQENPTIAAHREELRKKQERLRSASQELLGIGTM